MCFWTAKIWTSDKYIKIALSMSKMHLSYLSFLENEYKNREESRIEQNIFQYGPVFFWRLQKLHCANKIGSIIVSVINAIMCYISRFIPLTSKVVPTLIIWLNFLFKLFTLHPFTLNFPIYKISKMFKPFQNVEILTYWYIIGGIFPAGILTLLINFSAYSLICPLSISCH